ncbi:GNVR domain-containing protein [Dyadobacter sp. CY312]|uniref:GNVR domain-containing protein n=1 Tax=Dyadobacter sp. CY312 TaxID=2907303 RepID=UPI001F355F22|nr:GNVR domain-containing protein [Dyadobacter sp. CY312]MCE7041281.1 hypothetical protein [Dyadobacter sp. CY312]
MLVQEQVDNSNTNSLPEIHLSHVLEFFRENMLTLFLAVFLGGALGALGSYTFTKTYTAKTILLPEYSTGKPSFFSLAMGSGSSDGTGPLTPDLYPNILESTSFGEYMIKQPIVDSEGNNYTSLKIYLNKPAKESLLSNVKSLFSSDNKGHGEIKRKVVIQNKDILNLSTDEEAVITFAKSLVKASIEQKNGLISIESEMTDPIVAAQLVEAGKIYLTTYIEDFRVAKLEQQLEFINKRASEAKKRQQNAEYALQSYRDHNRNSFLNVARIEEQRLQSDYTLAQSIYSDLIIKLEQTKIKVKEERPVFKVLEATKVPLNKTSPKRILIAGIGALIGFILALTYAIYTNQGVRQYLIRLQ